MNWIAGVLIGLSIGVILLWLWVIIDSEVKIFRKYEK